MKVAECELCLQGAQVGLSQCTYETNNLYALVRDDVFVKTDGSCRKLPILQTSLLHKQVTVEPKTIPSFNASYMCTVNPGSITTTTKPLTPDEIATLPRYVDPEKFICGQGCVKEEGYIFKDKDNWICLTTDPINNDNQHRELYTFRGHQVVRALRKLMSTVSRKTQYYSINWDDKCVNCFQGNKRQDACPTNAHLFYVDSYEHGFRVISRKNNKCENVNSHRIFNINDTIKVLPNDEIQEVGCDAISHNHTITLDEDKVKKSVDDIPPFADLYEDDGSSFLSSSGCKQQSITGLLVTVLLVLLFFYIIHITSIS
jgi:hypothetical protein